MLVLDTYYEISLYSNRARLENKIDAIINFRLYWEKWCYWVFVYILCAESNNQIYCRVFIIKTCFGFKICVSNCNLHTILNWVWLWYFALWWTLTSPFEISWSYRLWMNLIQHKCIKWEFLNVWFVNSFIIVSSRNLRF